MMRRGAAIAVLCGVAAGEAPWTRTDARQGSAGSATGCGEPEIAINRHAKRLPRGTFYINDKSKGMAWLVALESLKSMTVELMYKTGNHESAVSNDGRTISAPWYENAVFNATEGGGTPGYAGTLVDLNSGKAWVPQVGPSPFGIARPHGTAWTADGDLLMTQQLKNGIARFKLGSQEVRAYDLRSTGCQTPHLVMVIPNSNLAVTGCRCTNPGDNPHVCPGYATVFDLESGRARALQGGHWDEGITVTASGDMWVGSLLDNYVYVFGFGGKAKIVENFQQIAKLPVPSPLRLAFDPVTNTVAVASMDLARALEAQKLRTSFDDPLSAAGNGPNLFSFDADSRKTLGETTVATSKRGLINMEGLHANDGFIFAPGFDTQAVAILDAKSLEVVMELYFPLCTAPAGFCTPMFQNNWEAARDTGEAGWNNWSGGSCPWTMRNKWDRRVAVLDGPAWSPLTPAWARDPAEELVV